MSLRVALAGATGLVGSAVARALEAAGHEVLTVGRAEHSAVRFDLARDRRLAAGALAGCGALVHAAGVTDGDFSDREAAFDKAIFGAQALLEAAIAGGATRIAYVSSAHVYGPLEGAIDERHAPDPRSDYAIAHFATEQLFRRAASGAVSAYLARPCAVFGLPPDLARFARWSLIPFDFPRQALAGRIVLASAGTQRRNFVAAGDVAAAIAAWLGGPAAGTTVANLPGPDEMSVYDFARLCAKLALEEAGRESAIERPDAAGPGGEPLAYRSLASGPVPAGRIEPHVRALMRALPRKAPN